MSKRGVSRSLRRHAKKNHASVGGAGHMGPVRTKPRVILRAADDRPDPMKVPLGEWIDGSPQPTKADSTGSR